MKLPIPALKKKAKQDYYLGLLLQDEKATGVIIEEFSGTVTVIGKAEADFTTPLEDLPMTELLDTLDKVISQAEEKLPADVETHKTIFGVKDDWVEEKKIKKVYLTKLKAVCDELDLTPTGFLVITEAVAHLIQEEEGAPVSAVLVELGKKSISVSLLRAGKVLETRVAPFEIPIVKTVDTLLKHFNSEVLPTRIIVHGQNAEEVSQEFISHQWSKSLSFLHVPQISLLPKSFDAKAVIYGAAMQLGFNLQGTALAKSAADIRTLDEHESAKHVLPSEPDTLPVTEPNDEPEEESETAVTKTDEADESIPANTHGEETAFGFKTDTDVATEPEEPLETENQTADEKANTAPKDDKHYTIHHYASDVVPVDDFAKALDERHHDTTDEESLSEEEPRPKSGSRIALGSILGVLGSIAAKPFGFLKGVGHATKASSRLAFILPPLVILALVGLVILYITRVSADVTLDVQPKGITQDEDITFALDGNNDFTNHVVAAKTVSSSVDGSVTTGATGKKQTGNQAKGTVTIYNNADSSKSFSKGTTITSSNNLAFTLDKDVTVASASGDIFTGTKPGTVQVSVTAKTFGTEYNLPSGTKFAVSDEIAAKNDSAFSGGTKKDVTVIATSDIEKLLLDLPKTLEEKAKADLGSKIGSDEKMLPIFTAETVSKKNFDKNVGDEATSVTLTGTVSFETAAYKNDDILSFAKTLISDKFLEDQTLSDGSITTAITDAAKQDDKVTAKAHVQAGLLPKIDTEKILTTITGKPIIDAKTTLASLPQVGSVTIKLKPNIPFLSTKLPRFKDHIHVTVQTHE